MDLRYNFLSLVKILRSHGRAPEDPGNNVLNLSVSEYVIVPNVFSSALSNELVKIIIILILLVIPLWHWLGCLG